MQDPTATYIQSYKAMLIISTTALAGPTINFRQSSQARINLVNAFWQRLDHPYMYLFGSKQRTAGEADMMVFASLEHDSFKPSPTAFPESGRALAAYLYLPTHFSLSISTSTSIERPPVDTPALLIGSEHAHLMLWNRCTIPSVTQEVWCAFPLAVRMVKLTFEAAGRPITIY
jgi:hypothetical protein